MPRENGLGCLSEQNTTDIDVGQELQDMGILKEGIVLGLHPAYKRPYTDYGVA